MTLEEELKLLDERIEHNLKILIKNSVRKYIFWGPLIPINQSVSILSEIVGRQQHNRNLLIEKIRLTKIEEEKKRIKHNYAPEMFIPKPYTGEIQKPLSITPL